MDRVAGQVKQDEADEHVQQRYKQEKHVALLEIMSSNNPVLQGQVLEVKFLVDGQVRQYELDCEHVKHVYEQA